MRLLLLAAGWHLRWLRWRPAQLLLLPGGVLLALMADRSGSPAAQAASFVAPAVIVAMTLGWNDSRLRSYLRSTASRRSGALLRIALEGWLLPLAAAMALAEAVVTSMSAAGMVDLRWQSHLTLAFTALAAASAMAFTRGRRQKIAASFIGALLVLQLLLPPGDAPVAELLLPTAWPALSMAAGEGSGAAFHADIYMGLSMLLGVGVSVALGRRGLARPEVPQLSAPSPETQGG
ncbi:MAG: hypothetical protein R6U36_06825 [Candidatus Fermentibacteraceae bacterium]